MHEIIKMKFRALAASYRGAAFRVFDHNYLTSWFIKEFPVQRKSMNGDRYWLGTAPVKRGSLFAFVIIATHSVLKGDHYD